MFQVEQRAQADQPNALQTLASLYPSTPTPAGPVPATLTHPVAIQRLGVGLGVSRLLVITCLSSLVLIAFGLRFIIAGFHSAYMDESGQILAGRYLLEKQSIYANILEWSYGSFLWPVTAAAADILGGLMLVRGITALFGVIMTLATVVAAYRLAPSHFSALFRWTTALLAGLLMAIMPTAIGVGRFATYDALAAAAFMSGIAILFPVTGRQRRLRLLAAAGLCFIGFLSKYVIAIFFPFICLYLLISPRTWGGRISNLAWFVGPLSAACLVYFVAFRAQLLYLLSFSQSYTDLKSSDPFLVYIWERPEIWLLAGLASFGWAYAARPGKAVALGGPAILLGFQVFARADFDFWKHSIYLIFFLAPLAGLVLAKLVTPWLVTVFNREAVRSGPRRWMAAGKGAIALALTPALLIMTLSQANMLVSFYPDFTPALDAINNATVNARQVLTDDPALRYYLYSRLESDRVTDPFYINYKGKQGMEGYRSAISERFFDLIVLNGGVGPTGRLIRQDLNGLIRENYRSIYSTRDNNGNLIEIYQPSQCVLNSAITPGARVYDFQNDVQQWGARTENKEVQPGLQVTTNREQVCGAPSSLRFAPTANAATVGVNITASVKKIKARVYIEPSADLQGSTVPVGMIGFDKNWQYRDNGFKQVIPTGRWNEVSWDLAEPGIYNEIGLKFPAGVKVVYLSQVEIIS